MAGSGDHDRPGPRRTCIGCRRRTHPDDLVRVVRTPEGGLAVGRALPGRGAWLCPDPACAALADRRRAWARALRGPVAPGATAVVAAALGRAPDAAGERPAPGAPGPGPAAGGEGTTP